MKLVEYIKQYDRFIDFKADVFKFQNKILLTTQQDKSFMCDDYYLCKVLGCEQGKRYQA